MHSFLGFTGIMQWSAVQGSNIVGGVVTSVSNVSVLSCLWISYTYTSLVMSVVRTIKNKEQNLIFLICAFMLSFV